MGEIISSGNGSPLIFLYVPSFAGLVRSMATRCSKRGFPSMPSGYKNGTAACSGCEWRSRSYSKTGTVFSKIPNSTLRSIIALSSFMFLPSTMKLTSLPRAHRALAMDIAPGIPSVSSLTGSSGKHGKPVVMPTVEAWDSRSADFWRSSLMYMLRTPRFPMS